MINSDETLLDPNYLVHGTAAALAAGAITVTVTVIDMIAGADISQGGLELPVLRPVAMIRKRELDEALIAVPDVKGATLTIGAKAWEISNYKRQPMAGGEGEVMLILNDGDV